VNVVDIGFLIEAIQRVRMLANASFHTLCDFCLSRPPADMDCSSKWKVILNRRTNIRGHGYLDQSTLDYPFRGDHRPHALRMIFENSVRRSRLWGTTSVDSLPPQSRMKPAGPPAGACTQPHFAAPSRRSGRIDPTWKVSLTFNLANEVLQARIPCLVDGAYARVLAAAQPSPFVQNPGELTALERTALWIGVKDAAAGQRPLQKTSGWRARLLAAMCRIVAPSTNLSLADPDLEALRLVGLRAGRPISRVPSYPCPGELPGVFQAGPTVSPDEVFGHASQTATLAGCLSGGGAMISTGQAR
jgi:hypothetical protein